jgi:hypothetical protein
VTGVKEPAMNWAKRMTRKQIITIEDAETVVARYKKVLNIALTVANSSESYLPLFQL